ncbi:hypothetical protein DEO72_LG8g1175 [Vigna unguiculata]|uniref:Uncharacterized protein n=1 Tax=Vigna unguiculata TaxID=3917 RepID=A0A4D6MP59_VIGUN|nr:hypothetical protein DEO72_LG8g1175 [Vigna unguiculata]
MKWIPKSVSKKNVVVVDVAERGVEGSVAKEVVLGEGWGEAHGEGGKVSGGGDEEGEAFSGGAGGREEDGEGEAGGEGGGGVNLRMKKT